MVCPCLFKGLMISAAVWSCSVVKAGHPRLSRWVTSWCMVSSGLWWSNLLPSLPHYSRSWVNLYCVLNKGELGFYKDAKNTSTPYSNEPLINLSSCACDINSGYKKKKNVFTLKYFISFSNKIGYLCIVLCASHSFCFIILELRMEVSYCSMLKMRWVAFFILVVF